MPATASASPTSRSSSTRSPLDGLPATDTGGRASFPVSLEKVPQATRPLEARVTVRLAEAGGRAVERKLTLPVTATGPMIGVRPLFSGRSLGEGEQATFDVVVVGPDGAALTRSGLRYELLRVETRYQWYRRDNTWDFEPVKLTRRIADGQLNVAAGTPARLSLPVQWGRYRLEISTGERDGPVTSIGFDAGWYTEATADTPDMLEVALDKPEYAPGDNMTVAVTARTAGKVTLSVIGERLLDDRHAGREAGHRAAAAFRSARTGAPAPMWWRPCGVRSTPAPSACPAAPSACSGSASTARRARSR